MTHISAHLGYGSNAQFGKSTAPAITLPDHSAMYNVTCGRPQGGLVKCGHLQTGGRGTKTGHFVDVLYGRPLRVLNALTQVRMSTFM